MACCNTTCSETFIVSEYGPCGKKGHITLPLSRGFKLGMVLEVVASTHQVTRFDIKDSKSNILMHISVRTDDEDVVFNSEKNNVLECGWGPEERPSQMPFKCGIKYILHVAYESDGYRVFVNGEEFYFFKHRIHNPATVFEIHDGHIFKVSYSNNKPKWAIRKPVNGLYVQEFGCERDSSQEIELQGCNNLCWIHITGIITSNATNISFNLLKSNGDIVFHFNPRFGSNYVVRNSALSSWGPEETSGGMPLKKNERFALAFVVEPHCYRTYVNGEEFVTYNHRAPIESITKFNSSFDIKIFKIIYRK